MWGDAYTRCVRLHDAAAYIRGVYQAARLFVFLDSRSYLYSEPFELGIVDLQLGADDSLFDRPWQEAEELQHSGDPLFNVFFYNNPWCDLIRLFVTGGCIGLVR